MRQEGHPEELEFAGISKGAISFGLFRNPIALYSATRSERVKRVKGNPE
jgi:non-homologous end joining protein Ku